MKPVYVPKDPREKAMQRALIQYRDPKNYALVYEALQLAGRADLESIASAHDYVVTWHTAAVPAASTTFVLDAATAALPQGYHVRKTDEGLRLLKTDAFTLIIR